MMLYLCFNEVNEYWNIYIYILYIYYIHSAFEEIKGGVLFCDSGRLHLFDRVGKTNYL